MTEVYTIKQCINDPSLLGKSIQVQGWVKTRRDSNKELSFISLHDGSCFSPLQLIANATLVNYQHDVIRLTPGCSVEATGTLIASLGKGQAVEMRIETLCVVGWVDNPDTYPIQAKRHTLEFLREVAHLRPRTNTISAIARVRHCLSQAIHRFFSENGFFWIHTPIITASDCEGAGEMFRVSTLLNPPRTTEGNADFSGDFFSQETFLTVSGQLNAEAYCLALSKVYTFGPTFRAENSNTSRHLAEFWMVEPEIAFASLDDLCTLSQQFLRYLCQAVLNECADDMSFFAQYIDPQCITRLEQIIHNRFEVMSYDDAVIQLKNSQQAFEYPVKWGLDLQSEHERYLAEVLCKSPVILVNYPKDIKSFYMRLNDDQKTVAAMDVLVPGVGEIIGGSQREERFDHLQHRMQVAGLNLKQYQWYLDLRRYGSVPHAGFGLGLERLVSYVTGISNVRDVIPFPRTPGHAEY